MLKSKFILSILAASLLSINAMAEGAAYTPSTDAQGNRTVILQGDYSNFYHVPQNKHGGCNNSGTADPENQGSIGENKTINFGNDTTAYTGTAGLADLTDINVNKGAVSISSLENAKEGTIVTVASGASLDVAAGTLQDLEELKVERPLPSM